MAAAAAAVGSTAAVADAIVADGSVTARWGCVALTSPSPARQMAGSENNGEQSCRVASGAANRKHPCGRARSLLTYACCGAGSKEKGDQRKQLNDSVEMSPHRVGGRIRAERAGDSARS